MMGILIVVGILVLLVLLALYYGYRLAFYYKDPLNSPHKYGNDEQELKCKDVLEAAITEFEKAAYEEVTITSHDGLKLCAKYYHVADGAPLEIHCHGYKGNALRDFCGAWRIAKEAGHNVLLIDERCHGRSEGHTITFGILERQDVLGWIRYANERFGNVPIILCGVSMGAATVLMVSGMELPENVKGVIADCPYDAPENIIKKVLGQDMGMPVGLLYPLIRMGGRIYGKFDLQQASPIEAVKRANVPILLIHGDDDRFVPYEMSKKIYAVAQEKITFHTIHGAGHALNYATAPDVYREAMLAFLAKCV